MGGDDPSLISPEFLKIASHVFSDISHQTSKHNNSDMETNSCCNADDNRSPPPPTKDKLASGEGYFVCTFYLHLFDGFTHTGGHGVSAESVQVVPLQFHPSLRRSAAGVIVLSLGRPGCGVLEINDEMFSFFEGCTEGLRVMRLMVSGLLLYSNAFF